MRKKSKAYKFGEEMAAVFLISVMVASGVIVLLFLTWLIKLLILQIV